VSWHKPSTKAEYMAERRREAWRNNEPLDETELRLDASDWEYDERWWAEFWDGLLP
jgi:hypothetical protein